MENSFRVDVVGVALFVASIVGAAAQPATVPTERVIVTAPKEVPDAAFNHFVQAFDAPARVTGKLARWEDGICPAVTGLKPAFLKFVRQRVRDVAATVGVPVNADVSCKPNIEIVFTTAPQALLDGVRKNHQIYLGYHDNSQTESLAKVSRPIQAWYTTSTKDMNGISKIDTSTISGVDPHEVFGLECCSSGNSTGLRIRNGYRSTLHYVFIVADPNKLMNHEIGALADYIAMLALTPLSSLDTCQQLPSIINLLAPNCPDPPSAISAGDMGYLSGLYSMSADGNLRMQEDDIRHKMSDALGGR